MTGPFQDYLIFCAGPKTTHLLERMTYKDVLEKMLLFSRINWDTHHFLRNDTPDF